MVPGTVVRLLAVTSGLAVAVATAGPSGASTPSASARSRVVVGSDGYLFIAQDWTVACQDAGRGTAAGRTMGTLANAIAASGRDAFLVLGPDKSTVRTGNLPARGIPSRGCGEAERAALWRAAAANRQFLDLRKGLADAGVRWQTYWRNDTHWSPNGSLVYAQALARRLDPLLALRLQTRSATFTRTGDLAQVLGRPARETVTGQQLVNPGVTVRESAPRDVGLENPVRTFTTTAQLGGLVVPGTTVFVGDSFDDVSIGQLAPLFQRSVFVWPGPRDDSPIGPVVREMAGGDRVVVESVERFGARFRLLQPDGVAAVRRLPRR